MQSILGYIMLRNMNEIASYSLLHSDAPSFRSIWYEIKSLLTWQATKWVGNLTCQKSPQILYSGVFLLKVNSLLLGFKMLRNKTVEGYIVTWKCSSGGIVKRDGSTNCYNENNGHIIVPYRYFCQVCRTKSVKNVLITPFPNHFIPSTSLPLFTWI